MKPLPRVPPPAPGTQPQRARVLTHRGGRRRRPDGRGASLAPSWVLNGAWGEEARGNRGAPRAAPNASLEARPEAGASSPESSRRGRGRPVRSRAPSLPPAQEGGPAPPHTHAHRGPACPAPAGEWGWEASRAVPTNASRTLTPAQARAAAGLSCPISVPLHLQTQPLADPGVKEGQRPLPGTSLPFQPVATKPPTGISRRVTCVCVSVRTRLCVFLCL